jgi:hypothetical protein
MVIKASSAAEVRTLIAHLESSDPVVRGGAAARLAVIGSRAVDRLVALFATTSQVTTRLSILQALEGIGDPRALGLARKAIGEGGDVGVGAALLLRRLLVSHDAGAAAGALDGLVAATLDTGGDRRTRLAAFEALQDCTAEVRDPVAAVLRSQADAILTSRADAMSPDTTAGAAAVWADALNGRLPAEASTLHVLVSSRAPSTPLTALRRLIEAVRARETELRDAPAWTALRGSLHQALAIRGSRVALYDLRETVEGTAASLPPSFLAALQALGDIACLDRLAAAWTRAGDSQWREQLGVTLAAIARREHVTPRHAAARRIAARWPEAASLLGSSGISTPSRTRPRPPRAGRSAHRSR